jgi:hypothetical protein
MLRSLSIVVSALGLIAIGACFGCQPHRKSELGTQATTHPSKESSISFATKHCPVCGAALFHAIPHTTTREEIIAFAKASKAYCNDKDALSGWIHPGIYCPNGCIEEWIEFREMTKEADSEPFR